MAVQNTIRGLADAIVELRGDKEWSVLLEALTSYSRDLRNGLYREREAGVDRVRQDEIDELVHACIIHEENLEKLTQATRKTYHVS